MKRNIIKIIKKIASFFVYFALVCLWYEYIITITVNTADTGERIFYAILFIVVLMSSEIYFIVGQSVEK